MPRRKPTPQIPPLISAASRIAGGEIASKNHKLNHAEILKKVQSAMDCRPFVQIYRQEVLSTKTRTIHLLGRKSSARISNTLLGFEVKSSFKRIHCPDMVTARYLKLFTEIGCHSIKIPYDPTVTARLVPELESAAEGLVSGTRALFPESRQLQLYVIRKLYRLIRSHLR
jgi:hypothetical protein